MGLTGRGVPRTHARKQAMGWFDAATALFVLGLLYVIAPLMTWVVLARQHSRAVALWAT